MSGETFYLLILYLSFGVELLILAYCLMFQVKGSKSVWVNRCITKIIQKLSLIFFRKKKSPQQAFETTSVVPTPTPHTLNLTENQWRVFRAFQNRGPLTDIQLNQLYEIRKHMAASGARARRSELVRKGLLQKAQGTIEHTFGYPSQVWQLAAN